jgi:hypothetical protein
VPKINFNLFVVALTKAQLGAVDKTILQDCVKCGVTEAQLFAAYGNASPDDWAPFGTGKTVRTYLESADFQPNSLSSNAANIQDESKLKDVIDLVELFLIDPLYLGLGDKHVPSLQSLQYAIRARRTEFCIILSSGYPPPLREYLDQLCRDRLKMLLTLQDDGVGEWAADSVNRFNAYIKRFYRQQQDAPSRMTLRDLVNFFSAQNVQPIQMSRTPTMGF